MKYILSFISIFYLSAQDSDLYWVEVKEGLRILIIQRLVDQGDTQENLKLAVFADQLLSTVEVGGIEFDEVLKHIPQITNKRLLDDGDKLTEILENKFYNIENENLKFLIASTCKKINVENTLVDQIDDDYVNEQTQVLFEKYNALYGLILHTPKSNALSKLSEITYKSLSFKSDKLISLVNYVNKKIAPEGLFLEIESLPYCDNLKKVRGNVSETLYMGTIKIEDSQNFKLEEGNLAQLIQFIDLHYKIDITFEKNKIIIRKPDQSHWKSDILSYRTANALAELIDSPAYQSLFGEEYHTFQTRSAISAIKREKDSYLIYTCPQIYIRIPLEGNQKVCDELIRDLSRYNSLQNTRYLDRLQIILQADYNAKIFSPSKIHGIYLSYYNKFLKF